MRKALLLCLFFVFGAFAQIHNWSALSDTIADFGSDSTKYSKAFPLGQYENAVVVVKCDDSTSAGFASDSVKFEVAYQLGYPVRSSDYAQDTLWWHPIALDTIDAASFGTSTAGYVDSTGTIFESFGDVDTSSVSGWACGRVWLSPEWAPLIRYRLVGLTGNLTGALLELEIDHLQRAYIPTN